jgi:hypothetical protein
MRLTLTTFLVLTACAPKVRMQVLVPADVFVPTHIQTVAVIDRSKPAGAGEAILGILEGALTGEEIGADTEGRRAAIQGVTHVLEGSPRFHVLTPALDREGSDTSLFDERMHWKTARRICKRIGCEGIVALEAFDSDSSVSIEVGTETRTVNGVDKEVRVVTAERDTHITSAWRLYDVHNKTIVDDRRDHAHRETHEAEAPSEPAAREKLPAQTPAVTQAATQSGITYGQRIAPTYTTVTRALFAAGHADLRRGARFAKSEQWKKARAVWRELAKEGQAPKIRAKALHNIAVALEREGKLSNALAKARAAEELGGKARMRRYVQALMRRVDDKERVKRQMAG